MITIKNTILSLGLLAGLCACSMKAMDQETHNSFSIGRDLLKVVDHDNEAYEKFRNRFAQTLASHLPPGTAFNLDLKSIGIPSEHKYYSIRGLLTALKLNLIYTQSDPIGFDIRSKHVDELHEIIDAYDRTDDSFFKNYTKTHKGSQEKSTLTGSSKSNSADRDNKGENGSTDLAIDSEDEQENQNWSFLSKKTLVIAGACILIIGALLWNKYGKQEKKTDALKKK